MSIPPDRRAAKRTTILHMLTRPISIEGRQVLFRNARALSSFLVNAGRNMRRARYSRETTPPMKRPYNK